MIKSPTAASHTVAVFDTHHRAEAAVKDLKDAGFSMKDLSIIGQDYQSEERPLGYINTGDRMVSFGKYGAFWGTIWGLLFGSAFMLVPGIGYVVVAGYIIGALEGAFIGGSLGVLGGALLSLGIPDNTIVRYESDLKAGSFILLAHGDEEEVNKAREIIGKSSPTALDTYVGSK